MNKQFDKYLKYAFYNYLFIVIYCVVHIGLCFAPPEMAKYDGLIGSVTFFPVIFISAQTSKFSKEIPTDEKGKAVLIKANNMSSLPFLLILAFLLVGVVVFGNTYMDININNINYIIIGSYIALCVLSHFAYSKIKKLINDLKK